MKKDSLVSILVVNWNGKEFIQKCLESLEGQSYKNFEIILVDNASTDNSIDIIEKNFPNVNLIKNNENVGFAEGNNIGIKKSKGEIICLFNPDAVADKNWLSIMVNSLQSSKKIGAATGKLFYLGDKFGKDKVFCTWSKVNTFSANTYNFHDDEPISKVDYLSGAAMVVKKSVIDKIGLMDKDYFLYFDETDWCARMIRAGYELLYVPTAIAWHAVSGLVSDSNKKIYYIERSRVRFALKNFDGMFIPIFCIIFLTESFFVFLRDIKNRNFSRTTIRLRVIGWNISNIFHTKQSRKRDFSLIKKNSKFYSYNNSLPLKNIKTGGDMS